MQWIAPTEKDSATETLEDRFWDTADQFRANPPFNSFSWLNLRIS
jgi:hypothetical protein